MVRGLEGIVGKILRLGFGAMSRCLSSGGSSLFAINGTPGLLSTEVASSARPGQNALAA